MISTADRVLDAAKSLADAVQKIRFRPPVAHVYYPLDYAWAAHEAYVRRFGATPRRVLFLGMNPGPFGMMQTGVPFGEVAAVRDWMHITATVHPPRRTHPRRPVEGFACARSEVSGRRLWGLFAQRFGTAGRFFADHFVVNYCPLGFLDAGGRNLTPDKLRTEETEELFKHCDQHLRLVVEAMQPEWLVGIGDFAERRARFALTGVALQFGRILHPSPASPAANRDWAGSATKQLCDLGIW